MLNKVLFTTVALFIAQSVNAQEETNDEIQEVDAEVTTMVDDMEADAMADMEGEMKDEDHSDHEGHDHEDHNDHFIVAACLSKSKVSSAKPEDIEQLEAVNGEVEFDQMTDITAMLTMDHTILSYNYCVDTESTPKDSLVSFEVTYADAEGGNLVTLPRVGPASLGNCTDQVLENRSTPLSGNFFLNEDTLAVIGLGFVYAKEGAEEGDLTTDTIKMGAFSRTIEPVDMLATETIGGFYGATTEEGISRLGFIMHNTTCSMEEMEKNKANTDMVVVVMDEEESSSGVLIAVICIVIVVIIAIIIAVVCVYLKRQKRQKISRVEILTTGDGAGNVTAQNSVPHIETEDEPNNLDTKRSVDFHGKGTDRELKL